MAKTKRPNPFYVLLVVVGVVFTITACAYGVMTVKQIRLVDADVDSISGSSLMVFLNRYGMHTLFVQLFLLALATFAAIGTDGYWSRYDEGSTLSERGTTTGRNDRRP